VYVIYIRSWQEMQTETKFCSENLKERNHLGDMAVEEMLPLKWIFWCECVHWIHLTPDMVHGSALVNTVMNFRVS
jgi:hypothetical protein